MTSGSNFVIVIPAIILVVCLIASYLTRDAVTSMRSLNGRDSGSSGPMVDQRPWQTAEALAPLAVSAEEQRYASEAQRIADHEVDQAFAMALRQASLETRVLNGSALVLSRRVESLHETVKEDQAHVDSLTEAAKSGNTAAVSDELEVAKAQLALENDVLTDAEDELARESGDKRSAIQQELTIREAAMRTYDEHANTGGQSSVITARKRATLFSRLVGWFDQQSRYARIVQAKQQADADAVALNAQFTKLQAEANAATPSAESSPTAPQPNVPGAGSLSLGASGVRAMSSLSAMPSKAEKLAALKWLSAQRSILVILSDRLQSQHQLSVVYDKWAAQVVLQHRIVGHMILQSFAWIAFIILCAALFTSLLRAVLERSPMDRRRKQTLRTILMLATQLVALLLILFVLFGSPSQVPTIIGLATAGLTVALADFIIAFIGWFVLMGRNGIRVGDWVEINGVGGEVVEIGLLRTSLLETGNWTDKGHPTGRRVSFLNKFAISGQYFNFSTIGQWMWDEIKVNIPSSEDGHRKIELIHQAVLKATEENANLAALEWQRVARQNGLSKLDTSPAIDTRPAAAGTDIIIRYVTRAGDRLDMRNRIYGAVLDLLSASQTPPDTANSEVSVVAHANDTK
jgi:small-conductance mechanosensitive channel